jgi:hypothetical protein
VPLLLLFTFHVLLHSPLAQSQCFTAKLRLADTRLRQSGLTASAVMGSESCSTTQKQQQGDGDAAV